jgi:hypothetical protein
MNSPRHQAGNSGNIKIKETDDDCRATQKWIVNDGTILTERAGPPCPLVLD